MKRAWIDNAVITVIAVATAVLIGVLLKKSQDENRIKIERTITLTGNTALDRGYVCGATGRSLAECRAELWQKGTAPVKTYGSAR